MKQPPPAKQRAGTKRFNQLSELSEATLSILEQQGFTTCTPVQDAVIPLFCGNKDVAVDAATGSGKTLAFVLPMVEKLRNLDEPLKKHQVGGMVIAPTRELAKQIYKVALPFVHSVAGVSIHLLVGGSNPAEDVALLQQQGANVLIGTPGRLDDVLKRCSFLDTKRFEVLTLDEADRLLDMGFRKQLDSIMMRLPRQRRTGLFSATQTEAVEALARAGLRNPVRVNVAVTLTAKKGDRGKNKGGGVEEAVAVQKTPSTLDLRYTQVPPQHKLAAMITHLLTHQHDKGIVYFLTCAEVDFFRTTLPLLPQCKGLHMRSLFGKMKQAAREKTLTEFTNLPAGVLLCTDVAARGLDIPDVSWILQYDAPQDPDAFVHRVGRTARMGRSGRALILLTPNEASYVEFLRRRKVFLLPVEGEGGVDGMGSEEGGAQGKEEEDTEDTAAATGASSTATLTNSLTSALRRFAETDRDVMEKGIKAFLSFLRGYGEHVCSFLFRVQDLQVGPLASTFALLRIPKTPEVRKLIGQGTKGEAVSVQGFVPSTVDPAAVPYKDKHRERQRKQQLARAATNTDKKDKHDTAAKAAANQQGKQQMAQEKHLPAAKRRQLNKRQELVDLEDDYRLLKKLKKGKISQEEYDAAMMMGP